VANIISNITKDNRLKTETTSGVMTVLPINIHRRPTVDNQVQYTHSKNVVNNEEFPF
jgi:hypothetical protein